MATTKTNGQDPKLKAHREYHKKLLAGIGAHFGTVSIILGAAIYAVGFLTVFDFHDAWRLHGVEADFFKAKYLHVGLMFAVLFSDVAIPVLVLLARREYHSE